MKKKFLFDLDETLVTGDLIKKAADALYIDGKIDRPYTGADTEDFSMSNLPEVLRLKVQDSFSDPIKGCLEKKPVPGVYYFLQYLQSAGHLLGILTSRPEPLHEPTNYILYRDFPSIRWTLGVHFANQQAHCNLETPPSKRVIISSIGPHFYFDDCFEYCQQASEIGGCRVFLVRNKHTGWNKNAKVYGKSRGIEEIRNVAFFEKHWID